MEHAEHTWSLGETWDQLVVPIGVLVACLSITPAEISLTLALVFGSIAIYIRWSRRLKSNWIDLAVVVFLLASVISCLRGVYLLNSLSALSQIVEASLVYIIVRSSERRGNNTLLIALTCFGILTAGYSIALFVREYAVWRSIGFNDVIYFRRNLSLTGFASYSGNEHLRFILCIGFGLMSLAVMPTWRYWTQLLAISSLALNVLCVVLTFSRLAYFTVIFSILAGSVLARAIGTGVARSVARAFVIATGLTFVFLASQNLIRPFWTTLRWSKTEVQIRSLDGRQRIALSSLRIMKVHPWIGYGLGNFAYANTGNLRSAEEEYTPQPFNWFLQVGVEEGLVGIAGIVWLLVAPVFVVIRELHSGSSNPQWAIVSLIGVGAIGCFALGQGALFGNRHLADLSMTWLAIVANGSGLCESR